MEYENLLQTSHKIDGLYTTTEVRQLLKNKEATLADYILKIYYTLIGTDNMSTNHQIRLNNLIFNNFDKIKPLLEEQILLPTILEKSIEMVKQQKYLSLVLNYDQHLPIKPLTIQYFNTKTGIERHIIHLKNDCNYLNQLRTSDIYNKLISICGSNYYLNYNLKFNNVKACDNFVNYLFNTVLDYFPLNPIDCLQHLGGFIEQLPLTRPIIEDLKILYHQWHLRRTIIDVDVIETVLINFDHLQTCLDEYEYLPKTVVLFFASTSTKFHLSFLLDIYQKIGNCYYLDAISYFNRLETLQQHYDVLKDSLEVSRRTNDFMNQFDDNKEILSFISATYERIYTIVFHQFVNLPYDLKKFEWVLLHGNKINYTQLHDCYHFINELDQCSRDDCHELKICYQHLESVLNDLEPKQDSLTIPQFWCEIMKICDDNRVMIGKIPDLLRYIFAIPASNYQNDYRRFKDNKFKMVMHFNQTITKRISDNTSEFLNEQSLVLGEQIIAENRINNVED